MNVDVAYNYFLDTFLHSFDNFFPLRQMTYIRSLKNMWVNNDVKESITKLNDLFILKSSNRQLFNFYRESK